MRKFFTSLLLTILTLIIGAAAGVAGAYYWIINNTDICPQPEKIELTTADTSVLESRLETLENNLAAVGESLTKLNDNIADIKTTADEANKETEKMIEANGEKEEKESDTEAIEVSLPSAPEPSGIKLKADDFTEIKKYTELTFADKEAVVTFVREIADSLTFVDSFGGDMAVMEYFIQQNDIADDSVKNQQLWIQFIKEDSGEYTVAWTRARFQCQPERGHEEWSPELCS